MLRQDDDLLVDIRQPCSTWLVEIDGIKENAHRHDLWVSVPAGRHKMTFQGFYANRIYRFELTANFKGGKKYTIKRDIDSFYIIPFEGGN